MDIKENEVHIWRYILNEKEYHAEKISPLLSKEEKKRCSEYMNEAEKIRYTCNHRFVRQVLAKYLHVSPSHIEFSHAALGKPFVKNSNLFFNYSYRTTFGMLAISKHSEVGVDIEKMRSLQDLPTFAAFSFSEKEKEMIFKSKGEKLQETLFTFWTFKEAIIKALGVGLNADLTQIDLSDFFYSGSNPLAFDNNSIYTIKRIKAPEGCMAALAIKGKAGSCTEFNYGEN
jgi:4'-phosphopantetheinyl transferase